MNLSAGFLIKSRFVWQHGVG